MILNNDPPIPLLQYRPTLPFINILPNLNIITKFNFHGHLIVLVPFNLLVQVLCHHIVLVLSNLIVQVLFDGHKN